MLTKIQMEKYADVLIWGLQTARKNPFKPYDIIMLRHDFNALAFVEILYQKLIKKKYHVIVRSLSTPDMEKSFYGLTDKKQRIFKGRWEDIFFKSLNGNMFVSAPESLTHLKDIDPMRMNETAIARKPFREILEKREEKGDFGWTLCEFPTEPVAKKAKLSLKEYTNQIIKACFLNEKDPVKKWKQIHRDSMKIKRSLNSLPIKRLHMESKSCDLEITLGEKRKFMGVSGHNIPSFEIFTSPDWRGAKGVYFSNLPSYRNGNYVKDVKLEFKNGNVVKAKASQGDAFLQKIIQMDQGAKRIGEFSLTDKRFSKIDKFMANTLFDENFGGAYGNSHIAIGMSYSDTYQGNSANLTKEMKKKLGFNDSALHWDLVNTEDKTVTAVLKDGKRKLIYEKGMFRF